MRPALRALIALCLACLLVVPGGPQLVLYTCGMDGETRMSCCCTGDDGPAASGPVASSPEGGCCDISVVEATPAQAADRALGWGLELPTDAASPPSPCTVPPRPLASSRLIAPAGPRAPPDRTHPPIYIEVCSLLI